MLFFTLPLTLWKLFNPSWSTSMFMLVSTTAKGSKEAQCLKKERKMQLSALFLVSVLSPKTVASSLGGQPGLGPGMRALSWSAHPLLLPPKATSPRRSALSHTDGKPIPNMCQPNALLQHRGNIHYYLNWSRLHNSPKRNTLFKSKVLVTGMHILIVNTFISSKPLNFYIYFT